MNTLYSLGYSGLSTSTFSELTANRIVCDVRLSPYSKDPRWNRIALEARLAKRYRWIPDLGNVHYKGGPTLIKNLERGLDELRGLLAVSDVVVLCVCYDPAKCHRTVAVNALAAEGFKTALLTPPAGPLIVTKREAKERASKQRSLF